MKIKFIVVDITLKGGIERVVSILSPALSEQGHEVEIISIFKRNISPFYDFDENIKIRYQSSSHYDSSSYFKKLKTFSLIFKSSLDIAFRARNGEVIISLFPNVSISLGLLKPLFKKITFIASEHSQYNAHNAFVRLLRRIFYRQSEGIVTLTRHDKKIFDKVLSKVHTYQIYNPVSFDINRSASMESKRIITIGRLEKVKGYDFLIKQMLPFFKKYPDWSLDIYGDGPLKEELDLLINTLGLVDKVHLKGFSTDLQKEIAGGAFYVCSSLTEAFPMSFLEAFSVGMPIVTVDCPVGPREIVDHQANGLLLCEQTPTFFDALDLIINDVSMYEKLSSNTTYKVEMFSIDKIIAKWISVLSDINDKK
ncbi:glycosyltransferase family 4 protein [Vibrio kanaloae]|uniref:glycosyltransferase family 4 protein n=1 Tax=Vibrio kanaloae TaxID=170673 RepID=UPI003550AF15